MSAPYYSQPVASVDPTNVLGRRFGAYFIDLIPGVIAIIVFLVIFFGASTTIEGVGSDFCDRVNDNVFSFDFDPLVEQYDDGYACIQSNSDAILVPNDDVGRAFGMGFLVSLVSLVNLFLVQGITGATVGKHLVALRVVRADGQLAGFGRNAGRSAMMIVDSFCVGIVGLVTVLATKPHRRVGDMVAGTYVVHRDSVGTPVTASPTLPPVSVSAPMSAPPAWQPPPTTPPAQTWGTTPAPNPVQPPAAQPPAVEAPTTETAAAPQAQLPPGAEMRWDERWNAWLYWDPAAQRWLRHDTASGQWIPM